MNLRSFLRLSGVVFLMILPAGCGGGGGGTATTTPTPTPPPPPSEVITFLTDPTINCVQNVAFSLPLQVTGNSGPVTWTIAFGQLPTGLTLDSTTGIISGIPTSGFGDTATIKAADSVTSAARPFTFFVYSQLTIDPVAPTAAHVNVSYSLSVTGHADGAIASWAISSGQLPPGLTLTVSQGNSSFASISGVPSQTGSFAFTIQAKDSTIPQIATMNVTIVVDSHVTLTKSSLKVAEQNKPFSDSFAAVDGTTPYHWSITGILPAGLNLDASTGTISGTPTDGGSFNITVTVTDSNPTPQSDSAQSFVGVIEQLQIFTNLTNVFINKPFSSGFGASGGTPPFSWTILSGNLPLGLNLFPNGAVQGTPRQLGTSNFVVQATDSGNPPYVVAQAASITITPSPFFVSLGPPLSPAPVNQPYHSQIPASGGTPPYSFTLDFGNLPPGLNLDSTTGFIDGTAAQVGAYSFQVVGVDSSNPPQSDKADAIIVISPALGRNDSIATATPLGNTGNVPFPPLSFSISPYIDPVNAITPNPDTDFYRLIASGGSIVHVETIARRNAPYNAPDTVIELLGQGGSRLQTCTSPGFQSPCLNDDIDPSTTDSALDFRVPGDSSAAFTFYLHVFDWRGDARPDMIYALNITGVIEPVTISPSTLAAGYTRGVNFQQQFTTTGGTASVTWALDSGAFPPGWIFSSAGLLSGVATADGLFTFVIRATDTENPPQTARAHFTVQIAEPLVISSPAVFPNACVNKPYSFQVQTSGGVPPIRFGFISPAWPAINPDTFTGVFSGTPDVTGTFTGTLGAGDSAQPSSGQSQQVTLSVVNCP